MTSPPPGDRRHEPVADTRRRVRSATWLAAGAATAASAVFGILFAQPDPAPAAADPAPAAAADPGPSAGTLPPAATAPPTRHHHAHAAAPKSLPSPPLQPPLQPPRRATGPGRTTSGAS